jgi:hypothetical protein
MGPYSSRRSGRSGGSVPEPTAVGGFLPGGESKPCSNGSGAKSSFGANEFFILGSCMLVSRLAHLKAIRLIDEMMTVRRPNGSCR